MKKIIIKHDIIDKMISIEDENGKNLFYGNYWDFDRSPNGFKSLFEKMEFNVIIINERFEV